MALIKYKISDTEWVSSVASVNNVEPDINGNIDIPVHPIGYGDTLPSTGNEGDIFLLGLGGTTGYLPLTGGTVEGDVNIVGTLNVTDGGYQIDGATSLANLTYTVVSTW